MEPQAASGPENNKQQSDVFTQRGIERHPFLVLGPLVPQKTNRALSAQKETLTKLAKVGDLAHFARELMAGIV